ncbi:hypothetical protein C8F01DRAFT_1295497 [Mycena amicta]|nr:hypothetical protein C8F01DRAFT_1295497 [Mycena amicta]
MSLFLPFLLFLLSKRALAALVNVSLDDTSPLITYLGTWEPDSAHLSSLDFGGAHTRTIVYYHGSCHWWQLPGRDSGERDVTSVACSSSVLVSKIGAPKTEIVLPRVESELSSSCPIRTTRFQLDSGSLMGSRVDSMRLLCGKVTFHAYSYESRIASWEISATVNQSCDGVDDLQSATGSTGTLLLAEPTL